AAASEQTATSARAAERVIGPPFPEDARRSAPYARARILVNGFGLECTLSGGADMTRALVGIPFLAAATAFAQTPSHKHYADSPEAAKPGPAGELAPRLQNLGTHAFPVTTRSTKAQLFINQGVNLAYGFNHAEA